jgi:tRNA nucleotidyltransferase (CCA-adding enzyme)
LRRYDVEETFHHWQMRLEVLIAYLAAEYREPVAKNLQLSEDSIQRLRDLAAAEAEVMECLPQCARRSEIVLLLRRYELPTLILIAVGCPRAVRRLIWQYITYWSRVQPPLNGHDLKALGYKPGRDFKRILDELLAAALDGAIGDKEDAKKFLAERFPRH